MSKKNTACKESNFICYLERSSEIVNTWPEWKQNIICSAEISRNNHSSIKQNDVRPPKK